MSILFDYDPETGVQTYFDYDPVSDCVALSYKQDVTGFLDRMKHLRNDESYSAKGIKEEWWHYASIPPVIEMELRNKGLDLNNKDHHKAIFREINANYPALKSTTKKHA